MDEDAPYPFRDVKKTCKRSAVAHVAVKDVGVQARRARIPGQHEGAHVFPARMQRFAEGDPEMSRRARNEINGLLHSLLLPRLKTVYGASPENCSARGFLQV